MPSLARSPGRSVASWAVSFAVDGTISVSVRTTPPSGLITPARKFSSMRVVVAATICSPAERAPIISASTLP
jgi:hypothetical protein